MSCVCLLHPEGVEGGDILAVESHVQRLIYLYEMQEAAQWSDEQLEAMKEATHIAHRVSVA